MNAHWIHIDVFFSLNADVVDFSFKPLPSYHTYEKSGNSKQKRGEFSPLSLKKT
jgi:hypothetical protein